MNFFLEAHQYQKINAAERAADVAGEKASRAQDSYYELRAKQEKTSLICQALLEIIQDRIGITDQELQDKILEVDLRDGSADGKMGPQILSCPKCGQKTNSRRGSCFYCGTPVSGDHTFD